MQVPATQQLDPTAHELLCTQTFFLNYPQRQKGANPTFFTHSRTLIRANYKPKTK